MKNLTELQLKELLDLVDTEACDLTGEHSAKKEILRRFQELEQRARTAEKRLAEAKQTPDGQNILTSRPPEELKFKDL